MRDEDAAKFTDYEFMREQDRVRKLLIGNCRLMDVKNEKNGNYELAPKVSTNGYASIFHSYYTVDRKRTNTSSAMCLKARSTEVKSRSLSSLSSHLKSTHCFKTLALSKESDNGWRVSGSARSREVLLNLASLMQSPSTSSCEPMLNRFDSFTLAIT